MSAFRLSRGSNRFPSTAASPSPANQGNEDQGRARQNPDPRLRDESEINTIKGWAVGPRGQACERHIH